MWVMIILLGTSYAGSVQFDSRELCNLAAVEILNTHAKTNKFQVPMTVACVRNKIQGRSNEGSSYRYRTRFAAINRPDAG